MDIMSKLNFKTIEWRDDFVRLIDQTKLPGELTYYDCTELDHFIDAFKRLVVRGAPAIGVTAAYAMVVAAKKGWDLKQTAQTLIDARPTAVNLSWAVNRMMKLVESGRGDTGQLEKEAITIHEEDALMCCQMGEIGDKLIQPGSRILTHCNAGALATGGIGTALGVIFTSHFNDKNISVWVDETRPLLQGARLTAWELGRAGVPYKLITDNMAASLMAAGMVDCVITGADRIAFNCDVANKIGTYSLAVNCHYHKLPFYVAAPSSTFDKDCPDGKSIEIEMRSGEEITEIRGKRIAPSEAETYCPAFDITPHELITAIFTEKETIKP